MAFQDAPIRQKLTTIILGTCSVVLLVTCAAFFAYDVVTFRQATIRQLSTLGDIISANSTGVVAFDNAEDATVILSALRVDRHIVAACLYDRDGRLLARYPAATAPSKFPAKPEEDGYHFNKGYIVGFTAVEQVQGQRLGTLYLQSDMGALYDRLRLYGVISALVIVGSFLVAYLLSRNLQHQISRPILALADAAKAVSDRRDYSVRARKFGADELGLLTEAFNHMLGQIEEQNRALQKAYDDLKQTQQAITQQERLRALGQMASGIAHDINNAISPAALYAESLLARDPSLSARARAGLTTIQRAIDDVTQTVSRLREFYRVRERQIDLAPVDLNLMAEQVIELTRAHWTNMAQKSGIVIELQAQLHPTPAAVMGTESEIREALTNLIFNAVDAMPQGGTLTVRTRLARSQASDAQPTSHSQVIVEVADTGIGMDEETKRRCLEPFYTTKGERGTGLGLAMVYGVMRRHDATIEIESAPSRGTTMRLIFPGSAPTALPLAVALSAAEPQRSRLRLLVVDDDLELLASLTDVLKEEGHDVVAAEGGKAGIESFEAALKSGTPFAAVITDLGMPHVDGRRVAAAVKAASPSTPVFLLTGWGQNMAAEGDIPAHVDRLLNKPPKLRDLREALASL